MTKLDVLIPAAVMSLLRREETARGIAERLGVSEAQVRQWQDLFVIGGVLALTEFRRRGKITAPKPCGDEPTTPDFDPDSEPTTPDLCGGDPTTPDFDGDGDEPTTPDFDDSETVVTKMSTELSAG